MPLARILTSREADAATLCEHLHNLGYVVEILGPGDPPQDDADVEIELDRMPLAEALEYAAQRSTELGCDVWVAPGALTGVEAWPEPETQESSDEWQLEPLLAAQTSEKDGEEDGNETETAWMETDFFPDLKFPQLGHLEQKKPELTAPESRPELSEVEQRSQGASVASARITQNLTTSAAACKRQAIACKHRIRTAWENARSNSSLVLARVVREQQQWRAALQKAWQERCEALQQRRQAALHQRQVEESALHQRMESRARQSARDWAELAVQTRMPAHASTDEKNFLQSAGSPFEKPLLPRYWKCATLQRAQIVAKSDLPDLSGTSSLPQPSVWIAPEVDSIAARQKLAEPLPLAIPARVNSSSPVPNQSASVRGLTDAAKFWSWTSTPVTAGQSRVERGIAWRELQWRRAAVASGALALVITVGFAAGIRRNASSLLPSNLPGSAAAAQQESTGPASAPASMSASASAHTPPASQDASQEAATSSPLSVLPNADNMNTSPRVLAKEPALASASMQRAQPRITRAVERKYARDGVVVQHFGPAVVIRHFEQPSSSAKTQAGKAQLKDGVRHYSDLD